VLSDIRDKSRACVQYLGGWEKIIALYQTLNRTSYNPTPAVCDYPARKIFALRMNTVEY